MRRILIAAASAVAGWSTLAHAEGQSSDVARSDCVWPAVGGATAGVAVAWYGFAGIEAIRGRSAFDLEATPGNVALILSLETAGLIGGAAASCAIVSDEGRWFPTAGSVIGGGVIGGTAAGLVAFGLVSMSGLGDDTDAPVASALLLTAATAAGIAAGGYLGFAIDRSLRGPPRIVPIAGPDRAGVALSFRL